MDDVLLLILLWHARAFQLRKRSFRSSSWIKNCRNWKILNPILLIRTDHSCFLWSSCQCDQIGRNFDVLGEKQNPKQFKKGQQFWYRLNVESLILFNELFYAKECSHLVSILTDFWDILLLFQIINGHTASCTWGITSILRKRGKAMIQHFSSKCVHTHRSISRPSWQICTNSQLTFLVNVCHSLV
jgi:hypothetical protein